MPCGDMHQSVTDALVLYFFLFDCLYFVYLVAVYLILCLPMFTVLLQLFCRL